MTALATVKDGVKPSDFRRPGHMFPLEARAGGVLKRAGHTEATVDLCRLAGLKEVGLCCSTARWRAWTTCRPSRSAMASS